jgi:hypothetical protein
VIILNLITSTAGVAYLNIFKLLRLIMKKTIAFRITVKKSFVDINVGCFAILDKHDKSITTGGLRTTNIATCVGIIINSNDNIALAHSDTFFVAKNVKDILIELNTKKSKKVQIVLAYNPLFKHLNNADEWKTEIEKLCQDCYIKAEINYYAVSSTQDKIGITIEGMFVTLSGKSIKHINNKMATKTNLVVDSYLYLQKLHIRRASDLILYNSDTLIQEHAKNVFGRATLLDYDKITPSKSPIEAESQLDSTLHVWTRLIPINSEKTIKVLKNYFIMQFFLALIVLDKVYEFMNSNR